MIFMKGKTGLSPLNQRVLKKGICSERIVFIILQAAVQAKVRESSTLQSRTKHASKTYYIAKEIFSLKKSQ